MQSEVMFAGFGGQGILMSGKVLAHAALEEGYEVLWIPSYGPEMRGGTAYCMVMISDKPIGSPVVRNPSHLVAMNRPSLEKFAPVVKSSGVVLINSSLISIDPGRDDLDVIKIPVTTIAKDLGSVKAANIVALGAFVARSKIVEFATLQHCVYEEFAKKENFLSLNMKALEEGKKAVEIYSLK
ncbi:MAG: 2-oxoacid:acceptor oxidoreductase family protein [Desulfobacterales bacterium]